MKEDNSLTSLADGQISTAPETVEDLATSLAIMHATLESTTDAILVTNDSNHVNAFNGKFIGLWAVPPEIRTSRQTNDFWHHLSGQLKDPAACLKRIGEITASHPGETFDVLRLADGRVFELNSAIQSVNQQSVGRVWSFREITQRKRDEDALEHEKRVLEKIASGAPLRTVLNILVRGVEAQSCDGMICSVLIFDEAAHCLREGAAPGLPEAYNQIVDGIGVGPNIGSCGSAAYELQPVFATDISTDPHWASFADLAKTFGIGACCSTPVFSSDGSLLGTVAMYYREPHKPSAHDRELIRMATHLAGIVIERARAVEHLRLAKVAAEERAQEIKRAYDELRKTQETLTSELAGAVDYVLSLLPRPLTEEHISVDWAMTPSAQLGGDGLGYHWVDSERFAFYLLDVSGHGVKSALLAVSILDILRTCGIADVNWNDPGAVLRTLNRVYFSQSRGHLNFTIWYGIANFTTRTLSYASGGHPPAVLRRSQKDNRLLPASGPPVACVRDATYLTEELPIALPSDLYLFSDGVFETRRHEEGNPLNRLVDFLVAPSNGHGRTVAEIHGRTVELLKGGPPPDDCSILKVSLS
jgi:serine phosphatase RsbU (regulator of sigma subunit)